MTAARVALAAGVGTRASRLRVTALSLLAVVIGALITWQAGSTVIAAAGLFIAGMGVGPLYPLTVAFALSVVPGSEDAGAARATLATGLALTGAPLILAVAAEQIGLVNSWPMVALIALTAIGLVMATRRDAPPAEGALPA
jgi:MFS family permease